MPTRLLVLILPILLLVGCAEKTTLAKIACEGAANDGARILVVGDSWPGHLALLQGLQAGLDQRRRVSRTCAVSFPGFTANEVGASVRDPANAAAMVHALGAAPTEVVLVVGVNDTIQHGGPKAYKAGLQALRDEFRLTAAKVFYLTVPRVELEKDRSPPLQAAKHLFQRIVHDGGNQEVADRYERSIDDKSDMVPIRYAAFLPSYKGHEQSFVDGRHLTPAEFNRLGLYIASRL